MYLFVHADFSDCPKFSIFSVYVYICHHRDTKKESNLAKARAALDSEATERERLQVKLSKLKIDFDELEARKSHHIQILKGELEFEKKLHSADLRMVQSQHESRMVELEAGQKVKDLEEALSTERERTQNKEERSFYSFRTYHNVCSHSN
ncbi:prelamin-A/C-like [Syngnathus typhle]|uniref:prelamin-A/C-like n=1 Tax=Syngnathus typhle TaxID=161592 RepID=UPI002A6A3842|nr:prelamin-A/C-like [Syngnathus typhle]